MQEASALKAGAAFSQRLFAPVRNVKERWRFYSYRVPYCVPFWNAKTYQAILGCPVTGRVVHGPRIEELELRLARFFSQFDVQSYGKGRVALEAALRGFGVQAGDEVIVPTFCCTSVIAPVIAARATPVLADVGPDLNLTAESVEDALTPRTRAVIVPHLFGNPADIEAIEALARAKTIVVIDDAAQAFGATLNGRYLGTFGDAGIVSFGSGKVCFGTGGAVLISQAGERFKKNLVMPLQPKGFQREVANALSILLWRRWRRKLLPLLAASRRLKRSSKPDPASAEKLYPRERMSNLDAAVILTLLDTLDANLAARRERVSGYAELLDGAPGLSLFAHRQGSACLTQVVRVKPGKKKIDRAERIVSYLRAEGYEVKGSYIPLHLIADYAQFARRTPSFADRIWPDLIELPCEPDVPTSEVERISLVVRSTASI